VFRVSSEVSFRKILFLKALCLGALMVHEIGGLGSCDADRSKETHHDAANDAIQDARV